MDLKNCPFCNQQFRVNEINHTSGCYFSDPCDKSWNQRAEDPELTAARKVIDCGRELVSILDDTEARKETDSFTSQPMRIALEQYDKVKGKK